MLFATLPGKSEVFGVICLAFYLVWILGSFILHKLRLITGNSPALSLLQGSCMLPFLEIWTQICWPKYIGFGSLDHYCTLSFTVFFCCCCCSVIHTSARVWNKKKKTHCSLMCLFLRSLLVYCWLSLLLWCSSMFCYSVFICFQSTYSMITCA